jgi:hypothetical protein
MVADGLANLPGLWSLNVSDTDFNDENLRALSCSRTLVHLHCSNTRITDESVEILTQFQELRSLNVEGTKISDAGIEKLAHLKALEQLTIGGTIRDDAGRLRNRLSCRAVQRLKESLPQCSIAFACEDEK